MATLVGQIEKKTQEHVVALFCQTIMAVMSAKRSSLAALFRQRWRKPSA
ncbi:MAG: hypothetical protein Q8M01_11705 [Rubrivivax sp.]|nr:hypothetical protein [Rubrivivax sp.]